MFLALATDWRIMRTERGYLSFPEVNLGMRLSKPFAELAKSKCSPAALRETVLAGSRLDAVTAQSFGMVDRAVPVVLLSRIMHRPFLPG